MTDVEQRLKIVREAGQLGLDLLQCDMPPVSRHTPEDDDGVPIFEEDERFWPAWVHIRSLVDDFADGEPKVQKWPENEIPFWSVDSYRDAGGSQFATVGANYGADGGGVINIEFQIEDGWRASINDYQKNLTALEIGRKIGAVEVAVLANELQSPAETLDYWMTETLYNGSQSAWAGDRKASRQTVSDRVRAAREKLAFEDT